MFDELLDYHFADTAPAPQAACDASAKRYSNWIVMRDGRPFMIVNATLRHVRNLVDGFNRDPAYAWTFRFQEA